MTNSFFDRDLSWLSFNGRVLMEAGKDDIPVGERINFLSIFSSNLDEFFRVRMPALLALQKLDKRREITAIEKLPDFNIIKQASDAIQQQQEQFGSVLMHQVLPSLQANGIQLLYNLPIPHDIKDDAKDYFFSQVLAFIQPIQISSDNTFFPENNKLYLLVVIANDNNKEQLTIINVPSDNLSRFYTATKNNTQYIIFLEDIIKDNLSHIFKDSTIAACSSFKITRDAELNLKDEFDGDIAKKIEELLEKRDLGLATRLLHDPALSPGHLETLVIALHAKNAAIVKGGFYHNLKDFASLPIKNEALKYRKWPMLKISHPDSNISLFEQIAKKDIILHTPYHAYDNVLRFFNEAAIDKDVLEIYVSLYRVAGNSGIANALVSAGKNGKKVFVVVELKARFDEANNIRWAKRMKEAGVTIIYSIPSLKVHAKMALVKKLNKRRVSYYGLLSTGNFNENTARFYTDHILFTAHPELLREMELLFIFLNQKKKSGSPELLQFNHLLVAQFNLQLKFLELIDREIHHVAKGGEAAITIKLNNLEEKVLISKLYDASRAGVKINLIVRSICCLVPGVPGMSENITVTRIVDRYLEHGRIFIFHNAGNEKVYMGSADWMNRNIYRRIEVCFPVYDEDVKKEIMDIIRIQLADNVQAVRINSQLDNVKIVKDEAPVQSQQAIYKLLVGKRRIKSAGE